MKHYEFSFTFLHNQQEIKAKIGEGKQGEIYITHYVPHDRKKASKYLCVKIEKHRAPLAVYMKLERTAHTMNFLGGAHDEQGQFYQFMEIVGLGNLYSFNKLLTKHLSKLYHDVPHNHLWTEIEGAHGLVCERMNKIRSLLCLGYFNYFAIVSAL